MSRGSSGVQWAFSKVENPPLRGSLVKQSSHPALLESQGPDQYGNSSDISCLTLLNSAFPRLFCFQYGFLSSEEDGHTSLSAQDSFNLHL